MHDSEYQAKIADGKKSASDTKFHIPQGKKLIIIDAHDTILKRDFSRRAGNIFEDQRNSDRIVWRLREGFLNFFDYYVGIGQFKLVISSDGDPDKLENIFHRFGIQISAIYGFKHIHKETYLKQLDLILKDFDLLPDDAVFIGDSRIDKLSAQKYGVDFIQVPNTLEDRSFSFNQFLHIDFSAHPYGLELQKIINTERIHYNLSSPELVELAVQKEEGKLSHRGSLVVHTGVISEQLKEGRYIVREPSSEENIYWQSSEFKPLDPESFNILFLRLKAFLQNREIFIQDCYVGAEKKERMDLRVISQTAWHSLFVRNMFYQLNEDEYKNFFPEFTLIHVPYFHAIPEVDGTEADSFVIVHLAKKVVLIGGTQYGGEIRRAVNVLIGYFLVQEDILPLKFSSNMGDQGDLAVYWGEPTIRKSSSITSANRFFFGDAYHAWSGEEIFSLEKGCYLPILNLEREENPILYDASQNFSTILENVFMDECRKIDFNRALNDNPRACFPSSHFTRSIRSGISSHPENIFIFIRDGMGIFPPLAKITKPQAVLYLLLGYNSDKILSLKDQEIRKRFHFRPFFGDYPFTFPPASYALHVWQKLELSEAQCWLVNYAHWGDAGADVYIPLEDKLSGLIYAVLDHKVHEEDLLWNAKWKFHYIRKLPHAFPTFYTGMEWSDEKKFKQWESFLIDQFHFHIEKYRRELDRDITAMLPEPT